MLIGNNAYQLTMADVIIATKLCETMKRVATCKLLPLIINNAKNMKFYILRLANVLFVTVGELVARASRA